MHVHKRYKIRGIFWTTGVETAIFLFLITLFVKNMKFVLVDNVLLCDTENLGKSAKIFALKCCLQTATVSTWKAGALCGSSRPASAAHWIPGWTLLQTKVIFILEPFCSRSWSRLLCWAGHIPAWSRPSETNRAFFHPCQKLHNQQSKVQRPWYHGGLCFVRKLTPNKEGCGLKIPQLFHYLFFFLCSRGGGEA